jgi:hypothetical protein
MARREASDLPCRSGIGRLKFLGPDCCSETPLADRRRKLASDRHFQPATDRIQNHLFLLTAHIHWNPAADTGCGATLVHPKVNHSFRRFVPLDTSGSQSLLWAAISTPGGAKRRRAARRGASRTRRDPRNN